LHGVSEPSLPGDGEFDPPHTLPLEPLLGLFARAQADLDDPALLRELEAFVRRNWAAFDDANVGLVHGDPHLENVVWDGEHVSALIDLEWSRRSWIECDLEILLSFCDHPWFFVAQDYEARALARDYAGVPRWLRDEYPHWFAHPRCADRLAVLHVSRTLGLLHDCPARGPRDPSNLRDRRNHLHALLDNASFLSAP
jgi:Ser/Thr protein kinase RdoA (MazF antagonist)